MTAYYCPVAVVGPDFVVRERVRLEVTDGRIERVRTDAEQEPGDVVLGDLVVPGLANCHSHVFHRALRGRTHDGGGTFWTWREQMYDLAGVLDPDLVHGLASAAYGEMAAAGITTVGEFHYLHHGPGGTPYDDPNAMGEALIEAARACGVRIALLDACYLSAGFGAPPEGVQRRFDDGDAERWAARVESLRAKYAGTAGVVVGAAIHSVRAVPAEQIGTVARWAHQHSVPLHVHLSEQPAENEECRSRHGLTPTGLLGEHDVWSPRTTAVHATHLTPGDIETLGAERAFACFCPTTERDLADGVGPSVSLRGAGARLTLGSDSHAVVDPFEEMRAVELHERLTTLRRGAWAPADLLRAGTATGHESLGFGRAGLIAEGHDADLVGLDLGSVRTAGAVPGSAAAVFTATASDVTGTVAAGRLLESEPPVVAARLHESIDRCWERTKEES